MNQRPRKAPQGELFPLEHPSALLTGERREVLIPLLSMILSAAMATAAGASNSRTIVGASHDG